MTTQPIPVFILSGFLGSGKTTLLAQALEHVKRSGRVPAVVMNEIGEINLDGQLLDGSVPTAEMLSGCICCSIRGDFGMKLRELVLNERPGLVFIEATGVANPLEIIDEVTDASLLLPIDLKAVLTVVDTPHLLELDRTSRGKTFRLMQEQIRCANVLVLNKISKLPAAEADEAEALVCGWNAHASVERADYARIDLELLDRLEAAGEAGDATLSAQKADSEGTAAPAVGTRERSSAQTGGTASGAGAAALACGCGTDEHAHEPGCGHDHGHAGHKQQEHLHPTHDHVMAYTHYFANAVDSQAFENFVAALPQEVYRAKGILHFTDTSSRFMFQYAYREMDFVKITPQGDVPDVAVFIGEHFSRSAIRDALLALEAAGTPQGQ
ncbi:GTP-binding protein [Paenibacillus athensensis]|uniref:CobW C-terminal domain-containing protein n=1 Tax=Paenibacillus athensensis TaxID=1967502 RepID=A0A4Y8PXM7_9BACL|nr:GTP-binding protein [Paenibacillus athensensis]MCD1257880.1 GTP-binding protein [Paenibacillus athensensis]